jgi:hypothetical protein
MATVRPSVRWSCGPNAAPCCSSWPARPRRWWSGTPAPPPRATTWPRSRRRWPTCRFSTRRRPAIRGWNGQPDLFRSSWWGTRGTSRTIRSHRSWSTAPRWRSARGAEARSVLIGRPGIQRLDLDRDVLAAARSDLGDLRLERQGRQVPYVIERTSREWQLPLTAVPDRDPDRPRVGRWKIAVPRNLPDHPPHPDQPPAALPALPPAHGHPGGSEGEFPQPSAHRRVLDPHPAVGRRAVHPAARLAPSGQHT